MKQKLLVVVNKSAGTTAEVAVDKAVAVLRRIADVEIARTGSLDELAEVLTEALDGDGDRDRTPVIAGGDGSLHAALQMLYDRNALRPDRPLGLIPLGTGNDFARTVGITIDPVGAADTILDGRSRVLDLAVDDTGTVLVNAAHAGIGAEAGRLAANWKAALGIAAYPLGGLAAGLTYEGHRMAVEVDGVTVHDGGEATLMLGVGNGRSIGGGTPLAPNAEPDDGELDVVLADVQGAGNRYAYGMALRDGLHVRRDDVFVYRGKKITLRAVPDPAGGDAVPFRVNTDGEITGPVLTRTWTVIPGCWSLLVAGMARAVW